MLKSIRKITETSVQLIFKFRPTTLCTSIGRQFSLITAECRRVRAIPGFNTVCSQFSFNESSIFGGIVKRIIYSILHFIHHLIANLFIIVSWIIYRNFKKTDVVLYICFHTNALQQRTTAEPTL